MIICLCLNLTWLYKYLIIDCVGRLTFEVVSTLEGKVYVRNVKFRTPAPTAGQALIFDDILDNREECPKSNNVRVIGNSVKNARVRTRSGRVSRSTKPKDFE